MNYPITQVRFLVPIAISFDSKKTLNLPSPLPDTIFGSIDVVNDMVFLDDETSLEGVNIDSLKQQIIAFIKRDNQVDPSLYGIEGEASVEQWMCNPMTGEKP